MSTMRVDNIDDGITQISTTAIRQGAAKQWAAVNGTGIISVLDSFNVASITDNGVGDYSTQLSSVMPNANYSISVTGQMASGANGSQVWGMISNTSPTTSGYRYLFQNMGAGGATYTAVDALRACGILHGD